MYLDEDEVSEQVSTLKKLNSRPLPPAEEEAEDAALGIENGSFKWNSVDAGADAAKARAASEDTVVGTAADEQEEHQFELRDISVVFPEGKLSCITGPTASGKTALLVSPTTAIATQSRR